MTRLDQELPQDNYRDRWACEYEAHKSDPFLIVPPVRTNRAYRGWRRSCVTLKDFEPS